MVAEPQEVAQGIPRKPAEQGVGGIRGRRHPRATVARPNRPRPRRRKLFWNLRILAPARFHNLETDHYTLGAAFWSLDRMVRAARLKGESRELAPSPATAWGPQPGSWMPDRQRSASPVRGEAAALILGGMLSASLTSPA